MNNSEFDDFNANWSHDNISYHAMFIKGVQNDNKKLKQCLFFLFTSPIKSSFRNSSYSILKSHGPSVILY